MKNKFFTLNLCLRSKFCRLLKGMVIIMDNIDIDRINTLAHKAKAVGLTPKELEEQRTLRAAYIAAIRNNLRGSLENIKIQNPDGTIVDVKKRHDEKLAKEIAGAVESKDNGDAKERVHGS